VHVFNNLFILQMTAVMRKHDVAELLAFSNAEFDKEIKEMSLQV
jgi:hypothetical protein